MERWQRLKVLFDAALHRAPEERDAWLAQACGHDDALREELVSLLEASGGAGNFLETPAIPSSLDVRAFVEAPPPLLAGCRIGPYRLISEIGQGGMGTVYLAARDDDAYRKQVAVKLLRGGIVSLVVLRRFHDERQILANLDHPNIARLLDGGTTDDGVPYFVMEYVDGLPIDTYCQTHDLDVEQRLGLFLTACAAVHHAHQNLVVHRDLKPSNILVTAAGTPKLLDFGIAKVLGSGESGAGQQATATVARMLTLEYASPEQIRGEPVTTAADVYALGVLLYRLLAGRSPYRVNADLAHALAQAICEEEPEPPSVAVNRDARQGARTSFASEVARRSRTGRSDQLRRRLAGDLDTIVLRAMQKDPARRYRSVDQLADDIRRHLAGLPVVARKDTVLYRTGKFVRRHRLGVAAALLIASTLLAGTVATLWQARVAEAERARAERRFDDVRKLANAFLFDFHDAIAHLPGSTPARELLVTRALEYLDALAQESQHDRSLQAELATAYEKVGDLQGQLHSANIGDTAGARRSYAKALAIRQMLAAADPDSVDLQRALSTSYEKAGDMHWLTGDPAAAARAYRQALRLDEARIVADPDDASARQRIATSHMNLGYMLGAQGDAAGGLEHCGKAVEIFQVLAARRADDRQAPQLLATTYQRMGEILDGARGDRFGALEMYRKALAIREELAALEPGNADLRRAVMVSQSSIGDVLAKLEQMPAALNSYRQALAILEPLAAADRANAQHRSDLAALYGRVGTVLAQTGDPEGALEKLEPALAILRELLAADPTNALIRARLAGAYEGLGNALSILATRAAAPAGAVRLWTEARDSFQRSLEIWLDFRNRGATTGDEAAKPDALAREVARCGAAIARLNES